MTSKWSEAAETRLYQIESGKDITFNRVFMPMFVEWVAKNNPDTILEIGAGTGHISKALAKHCERITAIEPSEGMFNIAQNVLSNSSVRILNRNVYEMEDDSSFDLVISHLVAHVVEDLYLFLSTSKKLVKAGGSFLFSIPHPCFYNDYKKMFGDDYEYMKSMYKDISFSITKDTDNIILDVPYYHRPISTYINEIIKVGFNIGSLEEIYPDTEIQSLYGSLWSTPRYCVFRLTVPSTGA